MHVHADYPPPKSWDQFEELCADVFEAAWRDPALVRHGRAGQRQHGVDIVGRNGSLYPIGLQCKKKATWPVRSLTTTQLDAEVDEARKFTPPLKAFYVLTTAPDDEKLQAHVRALNITQKKAKSFEVVLLGWGEILRRATRHPEVADKHFGARGGAARSPLFGTFYLDKGRLDTTGRQLELDIQDMIQDFQDDPSGHIVVRQRESDVLLETIAGLGSPPRSRAAREKRIKLREELRWLKRREAWAADGVRLMMTDPEMTAWLHLIWDLPIAASAVWHFLDQAGNQPYEKGPSNPIYLRMSPPGAPTERTSGLLTAAHLEAIEVIKDWRQAQYGSPLTKTVAELPDAVRAEAAVPQIVSDILLELYENRTPIERLRAEGRFRLGDWTVDVA